MSEIARIADQMTRAHEGEAWHGPSVREALDGVSATAAAAHPLANAHSIWEIALHIRSWDDAVRRWVEGEDFPSSTIDDWPQIPDTSDDAWKAAVASVAAGQKALQATVATFDEAKLHIVPERRTTTPYFLMHGILQHALYHAGQIAMLKKASS